MTEDIVFHLFQKENKQGAENSRLHCALTLIIQSVQVRRVITSSTNESELDVRREISVRVMVCKGTMTMTQK